MMMRHKIPKSPAAAAGVDRGGTWTRVSCIDSKGAQINSGRFPTSELKNLIPRLEKEFRKSGVDRKTPLVIATRGAFSEKWKRDFLFKAAKGRLNLLDVISDAEAAYLAAFGKKDGLLLIAGTGSVAFFRNGGGSLIKTGGRNPAAGDPGSGRWLGRQYLKHFSKDQSGLSHRKIASRAATLLSLAEKKDGWQRKLAARAQKSLAALLEQSLNKIPARKKVKISLAGGLMENKFFRDGFMRTACAQTKTKLLLTEPDSSAQTAAARRALAASDKRRGQ